MVHFSTTDGQLPVSEVLTAVNAAGLKLPSKAGPLAEVLEDTHMKNASLVLVALALGQSLPAQKREVLMEQARQELAEGRGSELRALGKMTQAFQASAATATEAELFTATLIKWVEDRGYKHLGGEQAQSACDSIRQAYDFLKDSIKTSGGAEGDKTERDKNVSRLALLLRRMQEIPDTVAPLITSVRDLADASRSLCKTKQRNIQDLEDRLERAKTSARREELRKEIRDWERELRDEEADLRRINGELASLERLVQVTKELLKASEQ